MDMTAINEILSGQRAARFGASRQLNLGQIIEKLEAVLDKTKKVCFPFGYLHPTTLRSWRGAYEELAIGFEEDTPSPTVEELIVVCKSALYTTFDGYKGGDFEMSDNTPVWVANWGNSGSTAIVDVVEIDDFTVHLSVAECEY